MHPVRTIGRCRSAQRQPQVPSTRCRICDTRLERCVHVALRRYVRHRRSPPISHMARKIAIAKARIERRRQGSRQRHVDDAAHVQVEPRQDAAVAIDDCRDAVVGRADERQPLLDRAHARLVQVLTRPGGVAEPAVVGDVDQQPGPLGRPARSRPERSPRSRSAARTAAAPARAAAAAAPRRRRSRRACGSSCSQADRLEQPPATAGIRRTAPGGSCRRASSATRPAPNTSRLLKTRRGRGDPGGAGSARRAPGDQERARPAAGGRSRPAPPACRAAGTAWPLPARPRA